MTQKERTQWIILAALVALLVGVFVWNALRPGSGPSGRIPVIDEVLKRHR